jgi:titin
VGLRAVNGAGKGSATAFTSSTPFTTPGVPTLNSVSPGDASLTVAFTAPASSGGSAVTGYEYTLNDGSTWTSLGSSSPATVTGLTNGVNYSVKIRAVNARGASAASSSLSATARTVPDAPTISALTSTDGVVHAVVANPVFNGGASVTNFEYSSNGGTTWTALAPAVSAGLSSTTFDIRGLTVATTYSLKVRAVNAAGSGASSDTGTIKVISGASAPSVSSVTSGDSSLSVAFTAPSNDGASTITNYQYSTDGGLTWTTRSPVSTVSPIVISGLSNGTAYGVKLRAVNDGGDGTASTQSTQTPLGAPTAPVLAGVSSSNGRLEIGFTAPISDGGSPVTGYQYSINDQVSWNSASFTGGRVSLADLQNGTTYSVVVRAGNEFGFGVASNAITATPQAEVPSMATIRSLVSVNGGLQVNLVVPESNGGSEITGYDYSLDAGSTWSPATAVSGSSTQVAITGLTNGLSYVIKVRARNLVGSGPASEIMAGRAGATSGQILVTAVTPIVSGLDAVFMLPRVEKQGAWLNQFYQFSVDGGLTWSKAMRASTTASLTAAGKRYLHIVGLTNGRSYSVSVRAIYAASVPGAIVTAPGQGSTTISGTPRTKPSSPRISSISTSNREITIHFDAPTNNGGAPITNYAYSFGGDKWVVLSPKNASSPIVIPNLLAGRTYSVRLRAINVAGPGQASGISAIVVKR